MASGDPVNVHSYQNGDESLYKYQFGLGDNGDISMHNPGMLDPQTLNPAASGYLDNLKSLSSQYGDVAKNYMNGSYYDQMKAYTGQQAQTSVDNNMARMGMAGSSAALGAGMQAQQQNSMGWDQKRLQDAGMATGVLSGLDQRGYQGVMGIQGQYGQFQNSMADAYINMLNAQQNQANGTNQLIGSGIGGVAGAGGTAAGMAMMG